MIYISCLCQHLIFMQFPTVIKVDELMSIQDPVSELHGILIYKHTISLQISVNFH